MYAHNLEERFLEGCAPFEEVLFVYPKHKANMTDVKSKC